jgi:hypothetical protein
VNHRLVLVGGLHRSGTSPLARALGSHPQVSALAGTGVVEDEGQHLQDVYPVAKTYGGSGRFALDPRSHLTEGSPLATPDAGARLRAAWDPYWDLSREWLVEKSPPNLVMGRFLQHVLPGSSLVVVVRHPVVVALSTKKWRGVRTLRPGKFESLASLVGHWVRAHQVLRDDLAHLDRVHVVHYEHLLADPRGELDALGAFLGLPGPVPDTALRRGHSDPYERAWRRLGHPLHPLHAGRRAVVRRYADEVAALGYDVEDLTAPPRRVLAARSGR